MVRMARVWGLALLLVPLAGCASSGDPASATPGASFVPPFDMTLDGDAAPRGRVHVEDGTVVTDRGTLLRGVYWSIDWDGQLPDRQALADIRDLGLNAIHVFGESDDGLPAGAYMEQIDTMVRWCGELGLYCVLTIGIGREYNEAKAWFGEDFWTVYAPRYKDVPWVLYEVYNEPEWGEAPYRDDTMQMEQDLYDLIRGYAPDTHILLLTYTGLVDADGVQEDVERLDVDWSNASVAWHGYGVDLEAEKECLLGMRAAGIVSMTTELPVGQCCEEGWVDEDPPWWSDPYVNVDKIRFAEENHTSWLTHITLEYIHDDWRFRDRIDDAGICWVPDYGTWPSASCAV